MTSTLFFVCIRSARMNVFFSSFHLLLFMSFILSTHCFSLPFDFGPASRCLTMDDRQRRKQCCHYIIFLLVFIFFSFFVDLSDAIRDDFKLSSEMNFNIDQLVLFNFNCKIITVFFGVQLNNIHMFNTGIQQLFFSF